MSILNLDSQKIVTVYIGDDTSDEEAFHSLKGLGIGIRVNGSGPGATEAEYVLNGPDEVVSFLGRINQSYKGEGKVWRHGH